MERTLKANLGISNHSPIILALGDSRNLQELSQAAWAFDVLKYTHPTVVMVMPIDVSLQSVLEDKARQLAKDDYRIHFIDHEMVSAALFFQVDLVWSTLTWGGKLQLQQAISANRPVIRFSRADDGPHSQIQPAEIIVPAGDVVAIARESWKWLCTPISPANKLDSVV
jgi:hypothetical protein